MNDYYWQFHVLIKGLGVQSRFALRKPQNVEQSTRTVNCDMRLNSVCFVFRESDDFCMHVFSVTSWIHNEMYGKVEWIISQLLMCVNGSGKLDALCMLEILRSQRSGNSPETKHTGNIFMLISIKLLISVCSLVSNEVLASLFLRNLNLLF
jgi:hypothetical protein